MNNKKFLDLVLKKQSVLKNNKDIHLNDGAYLKSIAPIKDVEIAEERNPAHFCACGTFLGFRGWCSEKCYNKYFDGLTDGY